ncbi:MAG TPA: sugar phosphate nucleotidyltransferase [Thermomicrobiales bacterium]|nr:sugar phosphate nucleotidyltransferase [Thermomicrobiales bacterium]
MDVIFPVAGLGSRLRPLTWSKPKPLVHVAGKPMFEHVMDRILPYEPNKVVFITGYRGDEIEQWARETYPALELAFVEQPEMLGQTDAIIRTRDVCSDDALILFPDAIFEADFSILPETDGDGIIFTKVVEDPSSLGVTVVEDGFITRLIEKPAEPISFEATVGIYYFKQISALYDAIDEQMRLDIRTKGEFFIADAIQIMIDRGAKFRTSNIDVFEDCGNADALLHTNEYLLRLSPPSPAQRPASVIIPPSFVDSTAFIEHAVVGPNVSIGANAVIRDSVVRDAVVEPGANLVGVVIEHAVIGRNVSIVGKPKEFNLADNSKVQV